MKKSLILLLLVSALVVAPLPARADGISFGIPLPFPFVFYNFGPAEPAYSGYYYRPYYGRPYYGRPYGSPSDPWSWPAMAGYASGVPTRYYPVLP